jgi:hypothetical protein
MIEYEEHVASEYQPGVCNIGPAEIARRRRAGYAGLAAAATVAAVLLVSGAPAWSRLAVAAPVSAALSGFIQARCKFCAGYGLAGLQNMGRLGAEQRVEDDAARRADRARALQINVASIVGGLLVAVAFWRLRV